MTKDRELQIFELINEQNAFDKRFAGFPQTFLPDLGGITVEALKCTPGTYSLKLSFCIKTVPSIIIK